MPAEQRSKLRKRVKNGVLGEVGSYSVRGGFRKNLPSVKSKVAPCPKRSVWATGKARLRGEPMTVRNSPARREPTSRKPRNAGPRRPGSGPRHRVCAQSVPAHQHCIQGDLDGPRIHELTFSSSSRNAGYRHGSKPLYKERGQERPISRSQLLTFVSPFFLSRTHLNASRCN